MHKIIRYRIKYNRRKKCSHKKEYFKTTNNNNDNDKKNSPQGFFYLRTVCYRKSDENTRVIGVVHHAVIKKRIPLITL